MLMATQSRPVRGPLTAISLTRLRSLVFGVTDAALTREFVQTVAAGVLKPSPKLPGPVLSLCSNVMPVGRGDPQGNRTHW